MSENVVFDPSAKQSSANPPEQPVPHPPAGEVSAPQAQEIPPSTDVGPVAQAPMNDASQPPAETPSGGSIWKKIIIGVVIVVVFAVALFFFLPKGASNKEAKLTWWGLWEDQAVMEPIISDFQKENPNITITYIKQDPKQYREKLVTRIKNGSGPDLFRFHNTWVPMLSESLLPFSSDVISASEFKKNYYPVVQKDLIVNGGIYGIPLGIDSLALFVNTDILGQAGVDVPQNWDDFITTARALTVKDPDTKKIQTAGAAMGTYGNITHAPDIISLLLVQEGVEMGKFPNANEENKVASLNFYTQFAKGNNSVWDSTLDESILAFSRGNLGMYIGYSWDIFRIQSLNKDLKFTTHPVPQLVGREAGIASYWVEGVSSKSPNQKAALKFMQYLSKKETAQKFYTTVAKTRSFGELYARRDLGGSLKENKLLAPFIMQLDYAHSSFFASDTHDGEGGINYLSNTYLGNAVNAIVDDGSSPQSVIDTLDKGVVQVHKKYGIR